MRVVRYYWEPETLDRPEHFTRTRRPERNRPKKFRPDPKQTRSFYPIGSCCEGSAGLIPDPTRTQDPSGVPENPKLLVYIRYI